MSYELIAKGSLHDTKYQTHISKRRQNLCCHIPYFRLATIQGHVNAHTDGLFLVIFNIFFPFFITYISVNVNERKTLKAKPK